jgi:hypothetical protein
VEHTRDEWDVLSYRGVRSTAFDIHETVLLTPIFLGLELVLSEPIMALAMNKTVTTARAAEIVGIGYEGLRSYLKRGLLGASGILAPFVAGDTPAPDLGTVRAKWTRFGFTDLCLMHLAKQLMDVGLPFKAANGIVSDDGLRRYFTRGQAPDGALLLAWPPYFDNILFAKKDLHQLPDRLADLSGSGICNVLIQLDPVWRHVDKALSTELA